MATTHFVGREKERAAFTALWDKRQAGLGIDGMSGMGKTTLLRQLEDDGKAQGVICAFVDFETSSLTSAFKKVLRTLRQHLPESAYNAYKGAEDAYDSALEKLGNLSIRVEQEMRDGDDNEQTVELALGGALSDQTAESKAQGQQRAFERLASAWLDALAGCRADKVAILLDTAEKLDSFDEAWRKTFWNTLKDAGDQVPGLRVVVASRRPAPDWLTGIALGSLTARESDDLLTALGLRDALFRDAVYKRLAKGHPLVTRYAYEAWQSAEESARPLEEPPDVGDIDSAVLWVQDKILSRLDEPYRAIAKWMPLLRTITLEVLQAALADDTIRADDLQYLRRFDAFLTLKDNEYVCHDLLCDVQTKHLYVQEPQAWLAFHKRATQYWQAQGNPQAHLRTLYHRLLCEPSVGVRHWGITLYRAENDAETAQKVLDVAGHVQAYLPQEAWAELVLGRAHYHRRKGFLATARADYETALGGLKSQPALLVRAIQGAAVLATRERRYDDARRLFERASQVAPNDPVTLQAWALMEKELKRYDEARRLFERGVAADARHAPLWQAWALMEKELKRYDEARRLFERASQVAPNDPVTLQAWALMEKELKRYDEARRLFERGVAADASHAPLWQAWALMEKELKRYDEARRLFERGVAADASHAPLWQAWALMEKELKRYDEARRLFERGVAADASHAPLWQAWALMEKELKRYDEARRLFERGVAANARNAPLWQAWALMEKELKRYDEARRLFERGVAADASNAPLWQAWALMEKELKRYDEARRLFERGVAADASHAPLWQAWALMEKELQNYPKALELIEKARKADPSNPYVYNGRGRIYAAMGKSTQARQDYEQALQLVERKLRHAQGNKRNKLERLRYNIKNSLRNLR